MLVLICIHQPPKFALMGASPWIWMALLLRKHNKVLHIRGDNSY